MLGKPEDKALKFTSDRVRRAAELRTAEFDLTAAEQHEVGTAVLLAAEAAARGGKWREDIRRAMTPTEAETKAEAAALAEWETAKRTMLDWARAEAKAGQAGAEAMARGDVRRYEQHHAQAAKATSELATAAKVCELASDRVGRVRGENDAAARARRAEVLRGW